MGNLYQLLTRPSYVGEKTYKLDDGKEKSVKACWPAIIDKKIFNRVQKILKSNHRRLKSRDNRRYPYLLSKLTSCGVCNDRLTGKSAHGNGGKIPYYEHGWAIRKQSGLTKKTFKCKNHVRFQAKLLEPAVWSEIEKLLINKDITGKLLNRAHKLHDSQKSVKESDRLRSKVSGIDGQLDALAEHLSKMPKGVSPEPIFVQMQRLEALKTEVQKDIDNLEVRDDFYAQPVELLNYKNYLKGLAKIKNSEITHEIKQKIVEKLIHKIELLPEGFKLHFNVGAYNFEGEADEIAQDKKKGSSFVANPVILKKSGSNTLQNGGGG